VRLCAKKYNQIRVLASIEAEDVELGGPARGDLALDVDENMDEGDEDEDALNSDDDDELDAELGLDDDSDSTPSPSSKCRSGVV
jgi:hypothetical protein